MRTAMTGANRARVTSIIGNTPKTPFSLDGHKGAIEASAPRKYRMWVYVEDLEMVVEALTNEIEQGKDDLRRQITDLRTIVPVRRALFKRLEIALRRQFPVIRLGYEFLNLQQKEWRNASSERLRELCELVENGAYEEEVIPPVEPIRILTQEDLKGSECAICGKSSYQGKVHLRCDVEKSRSAKKAA